MRKKNFMNTGEGQLKGQKFGKMNSELCLNASVKLSEVIEDFIEQNELFLQIFMSCV
jgi:hypothetical protein